MNTRMRRRLWIHRGAAIFWLAMTVPAFLFWKDAVWFVIACSLWANIESGFAAAEGADDTAVLAEIRALRALVEQQGSEEMA